jgi:hypothetical protein
VNLIISGCGCNRAPVHLEQQYVDAAFGFFVTINATRFCMSTQNEDIDNIDFFQLFTFG